MVSSLTCRLVQNYRCIQGEEFDFYYLIPFVLRHIWDLPLPQNVLSKLAYCISIPMTFVNGLWLNFLLHLKNIHIFLGVMVVQCTALMPHSSVQGHWSSLDTSAKLYMLFMQFSGLLWIVWIDPNQTIIKDINDIEIVKDRKWIKICYSSAELTLNNKGCISVWLLHCTKKNTSIAHDEWKCVCGMSWSKLWNKFWWLSDEAWLSRKTTIVKLHSFLWGTKCIGVNRRKSDGKKVKKKK